LFKQRLRSGIKSELVLLLKPTVITDSQSNEAISQTMARVRSLRELIKSGG
jgi:type II secretory pathway component GspD/PulD (secretin)